jgi:hypothetical protein
MSSTRSRSRPDVPIAVPPVLTAAAGFLPGRGSAVLDAPELVRYRERPPEGAPVWPRSAPTS